MFSVRCQPFFSIFCDYSLPSYGFSRHSNPLACICCQKPYEVCCEKKGDCDDPEVGWYIDKRNTIELIKEEKDRIILKQRINGRVVAKAKVVVTINPNAPYTFRLTFDGTEFIVSMNGSQLFTMTPMGTVPTGTVGFQTKNTTGSFAYIHVN